MSTAVSALPSIMVSKSEFTPRYDPNLKLWLTSRNVNQTSGATDQLNDQSGQSNNATGSLTARPTYAAGPPTTVTFDGSNDVMAMNNLVGGPTPMTFVWVGKLTNSSIPSNGFWQLASFRQSSIAMFIIYFTNIGTYHHISWCSAVPTNTGSRGGVGFSPTLDTNYHSIVLTCNSATPSTTGAYQMYYDGVLQTLSSDGTYSENSLSTGTVGARTNNGGSNDWTPMVLKEMVYSAGEATGTLLANYITWATNAQRTSL